MQGKSNWEIKAVVGGFVDYDESKFVDAEVVEVDVVFRRGDEIAQLAVFGLKADFMKKF